MKFKVIQPGEQLNTGNVHVIQDAIRGSTIVIESNNVAYLIPVADILQQIQDEEKLDAMLDASLTPVEEETK